MKQGESFRQFAARFAAARRKLEEQDVKLVHADEETAIRSSRGIHAAYDHGWQSGT